MLLSYDLWHKCDKFISFILLISCHSCRFYFYIKMRSRIYKKTQNFSKLLDPGKTKDRIAKWIVLMLFTYTWSQAHKTVLLRRMGAYSWECIEDCHIPIRPGVFIPGIDPLRTLGGRLGCDNKLRVAHLVLLLPDADADIFIFTMDRNKDIKPWDGSLTID